MTAKKKSKHTRKTHRKGSYSVSSVHEDAAQRRKFDKGGRIEAYTWGEVL